MMMLDIAARKRAQAVMLLARYSLFSCLSREGGFLFHPFFPGLGEPAVGNNEAEGRFVLPLSFVSEAGKVGSENKFDADVRDALAADHLRLLRIQG
jgi:hypothetical protein